MLIVFTLLKALVGIGGLVAFVFLIIVGPIFIVTGLIKYFKSKETKTLIKGLIFTFACGLGGVIVVAVLFSLLTVLSTSLGATVPTIP